MSLTFIKKATPFDAPKIYHLIVLAYAETTEKINPQGGFAALKEGSNDILRDMERMTVLVCTKNGNVIGTVRYRIIESGDTRIAYISRLCVLPGEQRSGTGTKLLAEVEKQCRAQKIDLLALHSPAKDIKLVYFYYKNGYYIHCTTQGRGYARGLFLKELTEKHCDLALLDAL